MEEDKIKINKNKKIKKLALNGSLVTLLLMMAYLVTGGVNKMEANRAPSFEEALEQQAKEMDSQSMLAISNQPAPDCDEKKTLDAIELLAIERTKGEGEVLMIDGIGEESYDETNKARKCVGGMAIYIASQNITAVGTIRYTISITEAMFDISSFNFEVGQQMSGRAR